MSCFLSGWFTRRAGARCARTSRPRAPAEQLREGGSTLHPPPAGESLTGVLLHRAIRPGPSLDLCAK
jgi:hypothetical protein